ncbi:Uncharacterised protein [uncultured archaeon]|nr:Uncharacterised protein [uncultured archaeon]
MRNVFISSKICSAVGAVLHPIVSTAWKYSSLCSTALAARLDFPMPPGPKIIIHRASPPLRARAICLCSFCLPTNISPGFGRFILLKPFGAGFAGIGAAASVANRFKSCAEEISTGIPQSIRLCGAGFSLVDLGAFMERRASPSAASTA